MVAKFTEEGKLGKGSQPRPRVLSVDKGADDLPHLTVHQAFYYDQVGTNFTPDEPLRPPLRLRDQACASVRTGDLEQTNCHERLPEFSASRLAKLHFWERIPIFLSFNYSEPLRNLGSIKLNTLHNLG